MRALFAAILVLAVPVAAYAPTSNYIRLRRTPKALELQTCDVTLDLVAHDSRGNGAANRKPFRLSLISTVHLAEPPYYEALQRDCDAFDRVLFELLVDETSVTVDDATGERRLAIDLQAAPGLASMAARNRLATQVGALDCRRDERWVLADVSRRQLAVQESRLRGESMPYASAAGGGLIGSQLRALFSSGPSTRPAPLRLLLFLLPAPEAALLLDDWISSGGATPAPVLRALADAISRLDLGLASRLSFAQTLASGETTQQGSLAGALVRWRNVRAVEEVDRALDNGCEDIALLYGALHMRDLRAKLQAKYKLLRVSEPAWRTAWSIRLPAEPEDVEGQVALRTLAAPTAFVVLLLALDGSDWLDVVEQLLQRLVEDGAAGAATAAAAAALYFGRHALLYLALERWAFQWDSRWWAVESSNE